MGGSYSDEKNRAGVTDKRHLRAIPPDFSAGFPEAPFPNLFVTPEVHGKQMGFSVEGTDHFGECLRDGKKPLTSGEEGLLNMRPVNAAEESARKGRPVTLHGV